MELEPFLVLAVLGLLYWWYRRSRPPEEDWITQTESRTVTGDAEETTPDRSVAAHDGGMQIKMQDPTDTPFFLQHHGWEKVSESPERYVGHYRADGTVMEGGLIRTASGRRKFFVHEPTPELKRQAHDGDCFISRSNLTKNSHEVHFNTTPDSFGDGIETIENTMTK